MISAIHGLPRRDPWRYWLVRLLRRLGAALRPHRRLVDVRELPAHLLRDLFPDEAEARRVMARLSSHCD